MLVMFLVRWAAQAACRLPGEAKVAGVRGSWLHFIHSQEVEGEGRCVQLTFSFCCGPGFNT